MTYLEHQKEFYFYLKGHCGSFTTHLLNAIMKADSENLFKLKQSFPEYCDIVTKYKNVDGYAEELELDVEIFLGIASPEDKVKKSIQVLSETENFRDIRDIV